jgi:hypothetical protein
MRDPDTEAALAAAFENGRPRDVTRLHRRDDMPDGMERAGAWPIAELRRPTHMLTRILARARPSPVLVRMRSRSTSASPPSTAIISRPVLVLVSAPGSARDRNCEPASMMHLMMANKSKVERASRSIRVSPKMPPGGRHGVGQHLRLR